MAVIYDDIRQALEVQLADTAGSSFDIAWENVEFNPTTDTSYVQPRFTPVIRQPAVRGTNPQQYYSGIFEINVYTPSNEGPAACGAIADTIIGAFEATSDLTANGKTISIRTAERRMGMKDGAFYMIPVVIDWYIYSS